MTESLTWPNENETMAVRSRKTVEESRTPAEFLKHAALFWHTWKRIAAWWHATPPLYPQECKPVTPDVFMFPKPLGVM